MTDVVSKEKRSWIMSRVRARGTEPEILVRSLVHRMGWKVLFVWQCETRQPEKLLGKLEGFLHDE